ncbi:hypothetical protein [Saccharobesus litoralis]|nr:hypothetical protein [Saccharobesus litoralis]
MKRNLLALSIAALLTACGGGSSSSDPSSEQSQKVSAAELNQVKRNLSDLGYDNLSHLSTQQVAIVKKALADVGFNSGQVNYLIDELDIRASVADKNAGLPSDMVGVWKTVNEQFFLFVGQKSYNVYINDSVDDCWHQVMFHIAHQDGDDYIGEDAYSGFRFPLTLNKSSTSDGLFYKDPTLTEVFVPATVNDFTTKNICDNPLAPTKTVDVEIAVQELPQAIKLLKAGNPRSRLQWQIFFDINKNNQYDVGDLTFLHRHVAAMQSADETVVNVTDTVPNLYIAFQSQADTVSGRAPLNRAGKVTVSGNTLKYSFDSNDNAILRYIDSTTPIKVTAELIHPASDNALYGNLSLSDEGPWNWTSDGHADAYPDPIRTSANVTGFVDNVSGQVHNDSLDDQQGESKWIDIDSVKVTVN